MTQPSMPTVRGGSPPMAKTLLHTAVLMAAATASLASTSALAQADPAYAYGGLSGGSSRGNFDDARIAGQVLGAGSSLASINRDGRSDAWRLFGGYQFNPYWAVEAGYHDLGQFGFNATTTPNGTLRGQMKFVGASLDLLAMLPVSDSFSFFARAGAHWTRTRDQFTTTGTATVTNASPSRRTTNGKYGIGMQYAFTPSFLMRAEAERYRANSATGTRGDVNVLSVSLVIPLGRATQRLAQVALPAYVAAPPLVMEPVAPPPLVVQAEPAPVIMAPPVPRALPPARRRVSYAAESIFGFDQSALQPQGQAALDSFASELRGAEFETVSVEGHTDRLGSTAYNQALSQQRAEIVKTYLVERGGLPAGKVTARGLGESAPMPQTADCKGERASKVLIACLQPDRRVDIEVVGTR